MSIFCANQWENAKRFLCLSNNRNANYVICKSCTSGEVNRGERFEWSVSIILIMQIKQQNIYLHFV